MLISLLGLNHQQRIIALANNETSEPIKPLLDPLVVSDKDLTSSHELVRSTKQKHKSPNYLNFSSFFTAIDNLSTTLIY